MTNIGIIDEIRAKLEDHPHTYHPAEIACSEPEGDVVSGVAWAASRRARPRFGWRNRFVGCETWRIS
jgi:hypothetical protein